MTVTSTVKASAEANRMTLAELRGFLEMAERAGIPAATEVKVRSTISGHLKSIEAP